MTFGKWPKFQKLHMYPLFTPGGWNWGYFCSTGSGFRDTGQFSNCHIWAWNLASGQSNRSCTYTLFLPQGLEVKLIFALWAAVSKIRANYQNCPILGMKLGMWPKFQKLHMYPLSNPGGWSWAYFGSTGSGFRDIGRFSNLRYLGMKLGKWLKFQKLHMYALSTPGGSTLRLFLLYGQWFPR